MLETIGFTVCYMISLAIVFACIYAALGVVEPRNIWSYAFITGGFVACLVVTTGLL